MASRLCASAWKSGCSAEVGRAPPSVYPSALQDSSQPMAEQIDLTRGVPAVMAAPHAIASTAHRLPPFSAAPR
eukprot:2987792-Rhodomonas_salina.1